MNSKNIFICNKCGFVTNITEKKRFDIIHKTILCNCGERITMSNSYPNLDASDLRFSAEQIYKNAEKQDLENQKNFIKFLKMNKIEFGDNKIQSIIKLYEQNKENHEDNNPKVFTETSDNLEKILLDNNFSFIEIDAILASLAVSMKNRMRKPFIVITASVIEMLFNDFFDKLIEYKFHGKGIEIIKKQYSKENINKCIIIANGFFSGKLVEKANNISDNYMNRWEELRKKRNKIVHNNNLYISKNTMLETYKLLNDSINVFSNLIAELYSSKYNVEVD